MEEQQSSPRVNSALLGKYIGRKVRLTGKVLNVNAVGKRATVLASDGGEVAVQFHSENPGLDTTFVEVVGTVVDTTTVRLLIAIKMSDNLDLSIIDRAVKMAQEPRFAELFTLP
ncbi:replication factor A protein 3 [Marasmius fiardii PR-910]|nr:replication factor A protein 3 [Marasmius fiardii PR-910]